MNDHRLEQLEVFVGEWRRGHLDGQQVVVDCLTNLRLFAHVHAVDFDEALGWSERHFASEARPRAIVQVGLDGRSEPMLRYRDELGLPDHQRKVPSEADVVAWREWGSQPVAGV